MLKGCLQIIDTLIDGIDDPMDNIEIYEKYLDISNNNEIINDVGELPSILYFKFHKLAKQNAMRHNKMTLDQTNAIALMRTYINTKLDELSFSLNDFGEWNSKFTPSKQIKLDIEQYLNKEMKRKRRSYTFDEFIDEMSYAYKTFLHLNRIC